MSTTEAKMIRERDADGILQRAGFQWTEMRRGFLEVAITAFTFGGFSFIILSIASGDASSQRSGFVAFLWLVTLVLLGGGMTLFVNRKRVRAAIFHRDGTLETPFGLPYFKHYKAVGGHHDNIMSIERKSERGTTAVVLFSSGGDTVYLAEGLSEAQGLKVSIQLVNALTEMRQSLADGITLTGSPVASVQAAPRDRPLVN